MVVAVDPGVEFEAGVFDGGEAVAPAELLLEGFDKSFAEAVLLGRVGGDVFLDESVVVDHGAVLAGAEDQSVVVAQKHAGRRAAQGSEAFEQCFFQSTFSGFGAAGAFERMTEDFTGATVDDRCKNAPAIAPAMNEGKVGGPALVGFFRDGAGDFYSWPVAGPALGQRPAFEFHDAVDFLDVDLVALLMTQTAPCAAHAASGFFLVDLPDSGGHDFIDGTRLLPPRLVVGGGAREIEPQRELGDWQTFSRREQLLLNMAHEFASGRGFPR